jgi:hypothetical protein
MAFNQVNQAFWDLRDAPLHLYGPDEWKSYDPAMAAWLLNSNQVIRHCAIERLATATLHWDYEHSDRAAAKNRLALTRVDTFLCELENAQRQWSDVIPEFLLNLRWHGHDPHIAPSLLSWIEAFASYSQPPADQGLIQGTQLLLDRNAPMTLDRINDWIALLDAPSNYARGCAAYLLGGYADQDEEIHESAVKDLNTVRWPSKHELMAVIGDKEIERPGIAGPFWSPNHHLFPAKDSEQIAAALWMMDLLERRQGRSPVLGDMPYNDIEFFLHELCCNDPQTMQRMLDGGFTELALMAATEFHGVVEGVKPILERLAVATDPDIAAAAVAHLKNYYS